jgi:hypothetical protein
MSRRPISSSCASGRSALGLAHHRAKLVRPEREIGRRRFPALFEPRAEFPHRPDGRGIRRVELRLPVRFQHGGENLWHLLRIEVRQPSDGQNADIDQRLG